MLNNKDIVPGTILKYSGQETKILILEEPVKSEVTNGTEQMFYGLPKIIGG